MTSSSTRARPETRGTTGTTQLRAPRGAPEPSKARSGSPAARLRRRSKARGATFVEALCVMAVLVIVWAGTMYLGKVTLLRLQAQQQARNCAWRVAHGGCEVVEDCTADPPTQDPKDPAWASVDGAGEEEAKETVEPDDGWTGTVEPSKEEATKEKVNDSRSAAIEGGLLSRVTAKDSRETERPARFGGETVTMGGSMSLPCNTKPKPSDDLSQSLFNVFSGGV